MDNQAYQKPEADELAKKWKKTISSAKKHWEPLFKRMRTNRASVKDMDLKKEGSPTTKRANLMLSSINAIVPTIYAKNPEISATPQYVNMDLKLLCTTLETVTNRALRDAKLKKRAKSMLMASMVCYYGVLKVMYQRDIRQDPIIMGRINDAQDNIARLEQLTREAEDPERTADHEATIAELRETVAALEQQTEITVAEGLVIDKVLSDNLLIDPAVCELDDYVDADWIAQVVPMKRSSAEGLYKVNLSDAKTYRGGGGSENQNEDRRIASAMPGMGDSDPLIAIIEIWDKQSQRVYTMADGCDFWCRAPYSPDTVGERWYPFFLLPFNTVDGDFVGPCFVDLTETLEKEYNDTRDKFAEHRDMNRPGMIADGADIKEKDVKRITSSEVGEIVIVGTDGARPLNQVIMPKPTVPINPVDYDTDAIRADWEQVTGLQDAARSTVVTPKTATEASIMQQSLSGRVAEMRDRMEDFLQELAQYSAQILLMNLSDQQVERYMGPGKETGAVDAFGQPVIQKSYEWPQLSRDDVFNMVQMEIRAGSTGAPDKFKQQENWSKALPIVMQLITQIMQLSAQGMDYSPLQAILEETLRRFDERIDIEEFLPKPATQPQVMPGAPSMPAPAANEPQLPPQQGGLPPPPPAMAQLMAQGVQ